MCGGTLHDSLQPGPCGIAQANAFKTGDPGCECPVDDRPVKKTPECSTCGADEIQELCQPDGQPAWCWFSIGALSCKEAFSCALQGFAPQVLCDATKNEIANNGCCGTINGNPSLPSPPLLPPAPTATPLCTCTSNSDCLLFGLSCDERTTPYVCSDCLSRAAWIARRLSIASCMCVTFE